MMYTQVLTNNKEQVECNHHYSLTKDCYHQNKHHQPHGYMCSNSPILHELENEMIEEVVMDTQLQVGTLGEIDDANA